MSVRDRSAAASSVIRSIARSTHLVSRSTGNTIGANAFTGPWATEPEAASSTRVPSPPKSEALVYQPGDRIIVLAED
jgi:hypothetical protein